MFTNISLRTQNAKSGLKNFWLIFPLSRKIFIVSKYMYLPIDSLPETLHLIYIASFAVDHHFHNQIYTTVTSHNNFTHFPTAESFLSIQTLWKCWQRVISRTTLDFSILYTEIWVSGVTWHGCCVIVKSAETALFNAFFGNFDIR